MQYAITKQEMKSNPKQPSCKEVCDPKKAILKKRCEVAAKKCL